MTNTKKIIITVLVVAGIVSGTAIAARGADSHGERMVSRLTERLDLDEQQAQALEALHEELRETRQLVRGNSQGDRQTLAGLVGAEVFDQGAALELITQRTTAMQTQGPELVAAAASFLDGLNAEQKAQLTDLMERFSDRRGRHNRGSDE